MLKTLKAAFQQFATRMRNVTHPVPVPMSKIEQIFQTKNENYVFSPDLHGPIMINLFEGTPNRGPHFSAAARCYRSDPKKKVILKGVPSDFRDMPDEPDREIPTSSTVMYTEGTAYGKKSVAVLIRRTARNYFDISKSAIFGLYGVCDDEGNLKIKKVMLPQLDENGKTSGLYFEELTPDNVDRALRYAEKCVKQAFEKAPVDPIQNMIQTGYRRDQNTGRWITPPPKPPQTEAPAPKA